MIPFLQSVATELTARNGADIKNFVIVLPHKRGVTYMRRYFEMAVSDIIGRNPVRSEMPVLVSIAEHIEHISGLKKASRLQLMFTLYSAYLKLFADSPTPSVESFESFRRWGETVISDFNDVDMYDVDADALFKNLANHNDIATDYLTPEQKEVIRQYFGVELPGLEVERFWQKIHKQGDMQKHFLSLWEKLAPLYHEYTRSLLSKHLSYPGLAFKTAAQKVESEQFRFKASRVIYVGFNALSITERRFFKAMCKLKGPDGNQLADFFWDSPGPALAEHSPVDAGKFLRRNAKDFPCSIPDMDKYADANTFPKSVKEISCPGNVAQAKVISSLLADIIQGKGSPYVDPARVAVVLPDEGLLFPVFHSVPADVAGKVNLTMGYPLRHTSVASFVGLIRQLQLRSRSTRGTLHFFNKDISALLCHPLIRSFLGQHTANVIHGFMLKSRLYFASVKDLMSVFDSSEYKKNNPEPEEVRSLRRERVNAIFAPLPKDEDPSAAIGYITGLLDRIRSAIQADTPEEAAKAAGASIETVYLDRYIDAFSEFAQLCAEHNMKMPPHTAISMACRLLHNDTVSLQGVPLSGLQIMGMLETRALDFDYLIIPSMNERIFPRRLRPRTFIPDALRTGYGIATTRFQEEIFAYHFYRLIARAKEVYLLYDASQGGLKSGDPSRYLLQLRYLFKGRNNQERLSARFSLNSDTEQINREIPKDSAIADILAKYLTPGSGKRLSASSLKKYLNCPLQFYFAYIKGLHVDEQPTEYMGAAAMGNVLHKSLEMIYNSAKPFADKNSDNPVRISPELIQGWLDGNPVGKYQNIHEIATINMRNEYMHGAPDETPLPGDAVIILKMLELQIRWCLEADLKLAPFVYLASEFNRDDALYEFAPGKKVNMKVVIDRLDRVNLPGAPNVLRIVDYKTGQDELSFSNISEIFGNDYKKLAIFQLMLYAIIYSNQYAKKRGEPIALSIYKTRRMQSAQTDTTITGPMGLVNSHIRYEQEFKDRLNEKLTELFDTNTPFRPGDGLPNFSPMARKPCLYCPYANLCGK